MFPAPPRHCMLITSRPKDESDSEQKRDPPPPPPPPPKPQKAPTQSSSTASKPEPAALALLAKKMPILDPRLQTLRDRSLQVEVFRSEGDTHAALLRYHY